MEMEKARIGASSKYFENFCEISLTALSCYIRNDGTPAVLSDCGGGCVRYW